MHREDSNSEDAEQWYLIVDGHGVMRFTNGDSVEFEPGDLLVCYPATGHSLQATGDRPARMIAITPSFFGDSGRVIDVLPEKFEPRICVTSIDETKNPLTAACSVCSAKWERPESDRGANTLPTWSIEHACTQPFNPIHE
jgi:oxalate decarboxylase/phosphoglucose isomerase-like protein (cupin superfamily)